VLLVVKAYSLSLRISPDRLIMNLLSINKRGFSYI
jgi:hypothetical protein